MSTRYIEVSKWKCGVEGWIYGLEEKSVRDTNLPNIGIEFALETVNREGIKFAMETVNRERI